MKEEEEQQNISSKMKGLMEVGEELKSKLYDLERWESMTQARMSTAFLKKLSKVSRYSRSILEILIPS